MVKEKENKTINFKNTIILVQSSFKYLMLGLTYFFNYIEEIPQTKKEKVSPNINKKICIDDSISSINSDDNHNDHDNHTFDINHDIHFSLTKNHKKIKI